VFPPLEPYSGYLSDWYASFTLQLIIVGVLALVGLSLAALGLYAMVAYHVTSRSREIGIRMALGAPGGRLFSTVVAQGVVTSAMGLAAGLGIWYAAAPRIRVFMVGMDTADSWTPALAVALVGGMSVLATLAPAWRSTAVDPSVTLRAE